MWFFDIFPGNIYHGDVLKGGAYSGFGEGKNNPLMQDWPDEGPIPEGHYTVGVIYDHHPQLGDYAIELIPDATNNMYGREGFFWHGDSRSHPGSASHGCIISSRALRETFVESGDTLTVRAGDAFREISQRTEGGDPPKALNNSKAAA